MFVGISDNKKKCKTLCKIAGETEYIDNHVFELLKSQMIKTQQISNSNPKFKQRIISGTQNKNKMSKPNLLNEI